MKRNFNPLYFCLLILWACGDPTEQQANREKLIEGLNDHRVKRVTEEQILSAAFAEGKRIMRQIDSVSREAAFWNSAEGRHWLDSVNTFFEHGGIKLVMTTGGLSPTEAALLEAYQYSTEQGESLSENVQGISEQYVLYTHPVVEQQEFRGMWSLLLSRRTLIREL